MCMQPIYKQWSFTMPNFMHNDIKQQVIAVIKYSKIYGKIVKTGRIPKPGY